jgi:hypothetical protein
MVLTSISSLRTLLKDKDAQGLLQDDLVLAAQVFRQGSGFRLRASGKGKAESPETDAFDLP